MCVCVCVCLRERERERARRRGERRHTLECLFGSLVAVELTRQRLFWLFGFFDDSDSDATLN